MRWILFLLLFCTAAAAQNTLPPIGAWREHLPYNGTIDVTASPTKIYAATPYSLFSVSREDGELSRLSKVSGLSETGISAIKFDEAGGKLFIAYTNSNIDIIDPKRINNIPDLKRENIAGDKSIYGIYPDGDRAYLSTGFGILVLNTVKYETADTWLVGDGGQNVKTNAFAKDATYFYAATEQGLKRAPINTPNLADFGAWTNLSGSAGLSQAPSKGVYVIGGKLFALQRDSVFVQNGSTWNLFFANGAPIVSVNPTSDKLVIAQSNVLGGISRVILLNTDGATFKIIQQAAPISYPQKAIVTGNETWVADRFGGLSKWSGTSYESYVPNSPGGIATGEITGYNGTVYAAAGSVNENWIYQYNRDGIFRLQDGQWTGYSGFQYPALDSLLDFITVAIDPRDETLWGGSYGGGLVHVKSDNTFQIYKQGSPIGATIGDPGSYRVSGLAFDAANNLWVANYGTAPFLHVLKAAGTWQSFNAPFTLNENAVAQVLVDDADQKWLVAPKGNGLLVFNHGASLEATGDDRWRRYSSGAGNGNLPAGEVLCAAKDKSGFIWVGTADGIAVIQCPESATTLGCEAVLPVVKGVTGFANYLFKGESVRSIAVDGADRKWVATKNGVWLISPDGDVLIANYTEENSPLLSNDVKHIGINGATGEVFFGTDKGISSFRGTATEGGETMERLVVFPNPVPPDFSGMIGIKDLKNNSFVKITELNGRLVYQTRATGGQATWNGRDYRGQSIASGVYLVLVTDEGQTERMAGRIVFIGR